MKKINIFFIVLNLIATIVFAYVTKQWLALIVGVFLHYLIAGSWNMFKRNQRSKSQLRKIEFQKTLNDTL